MAWTHYLSRWLGRKAKPERHSNNESYSQEGEDLLLTQLMGEIALQAGFYVDVGAHHPTRFSNTWKFYQSGWRGINIDPTPGCMAEFEKLRPYDINLEMGISMYEGERDFYCYNETALNGIDNDRREELANSHYKLQDIIKINTKPLSSILDYHGIVLNAPNFLNIDVEGLEMEVLKSNHWKKYPFQWIMVEQRGEDATTLDQSEPWLFLSSIGYQAVAFSGRTIIYKLTADVRLTSGE